jgi:hypothetical protein
VSALDITGSRKKQGKSTDSFTDSSTDYSSCLHSIDKERKNNQKTCISIPYHPIRMSETEKTPSSFPSELRLSKQWDFAVERFIYNSGTGALVAGLASIVLFRE